MATTKKQRNKKNKKILEERQGKVVCATSSTFKGLEIIAKQRNAKGCFINRNIHPKVKQITEWLNNYEESDFDFGEFAAIQLQIAAKRKNDCDDSDCEDASCEEEDEEEEENVTFAGVDEIRNACTKLVENLPKSFRKDVSIDAESIALMCIRLCPDVPWLTLKLEIVQYNACWRWHQDYYVSRAIVSYVGPGTCAADDQSVRWDEFEKTMDEETNLSSVPEESIKQMETNSVLLMKGDSWPNIVGKGLTHKSPDVHGKNPPKRLLLKVDLNNFRPPINSDETEGDDEDSIYEEDAAADDNNNNNNNNARTLKKRLATSEGFETAKAWKVRRRE